MFLELLKLVSATQETLDPLTSLLSILNWTNTTHREVSSHWLSDPMALTGDPAVSSTWHWFQFQMETVPLRGFQVCFKSSHVLAILPYLH